MGPSRLRLWLWLRALASCELLQRPRTELRVEGAGDQEREREREREMFCSAQCERGGKSEVTQTFSHTTMKLSLVIVAKTTTVSAK